MWRYVIQDLLGTVKYVPYGILIGSLLYILLVWFRSRKFCELKKNFRFIELLFWIYVALIVIITFLSREGSGSAGKIDLQIGSGLGINSRNNAYIAENILLFVPFGFLSGVVKKKETNILSCFGMGFLTSFGIECLQLVGGRGIFQVDDILTNTVGACVGYIIYYFLLGRREKNNA